MWPFALAAPLALALAAFDFTSVRRLFSLFSRCLLWNEGPPSNKKNWRYLLEILLSLLGDGLLDILWWHVATHDGFRTWLALPKIGFSQPWIGGLDLESIALPSFGLVWFIKCPLQKLRIKLRTCRFHPASQVGFTLGDGVLIGCDCMTWNSVGPMTLLYNTLHIKFGLQHWYMLSIPLFGVARHHPLGIEFRQIPVIFLKSVDGVDNGLLQPGNWVGMCGYVIYYVVK